MKKKVLFIGGAVLAVIAWYAFRPERLFVNASVNESFPAAAPAAVSNSPVALATGSFHGVAHDGVGKATIYRLPDGKRVLRLTEFSTSNGPDLRLFLVAATDAKDNDTVKNAGYVSLGSLKGNQGDQNYDVPADVDLAKYRAVTVWCNRFNVNFATAPLAEGDGLMTGASMKDTMASEAMPQTASSSAPRAVAAGQFHSVAHETKGTATLYQLADGKRVLRLTDFSTSNGPDVRVFLVAVSDATDNDTVKNAGYLELGKLKGNIGDQNYDVPADADLNKYRAATVWCNRFNVNFGTAPLVKQ